MFHQSLQFLRFLLPALLTLCVAPLQAQDITGAGATFPAPLYLKWFQEYQKQTGVNVLYRAFGSGGGIRDITARAVDFGASDAPMTDAEVKAAPGIVHLPMVARAVAVVYNLPGIGSGLHLTGPILAAIYLGHLTRWNDPRLVRLNPKLTLPDLAIVPVHGNASAGGYDFTTYLSAVSPEWKKRVGSGKSVPWPVGLGGKGEYVQRIKQNDGGIGYVELNYAVINVLPYAAIQNVKGNFVSPTDESATEAAGAVKMTPDLRGSIVNSPAPNGYPIIGFTYLLVYPDAKPIVKDLLTWCLTIGQKDAAELQYAPLPPNVQKRALSLVAGLK